ncbi:MAG: glycosyltransferase, partial [Spirochaetales bacterium]|nr:glycosyltransferase [Spirochaetales bacterium]
MTIAIVFEIFLPIVNGVITTTINLAENLQKMGHKVIFIVPSWKAFDKPEVNGIPVHYISSIPTHMYPGIRFVSPWNRQVEKIMIKEKVDVLQITGPWLLSWSAIKAARRQNIPVIQPFHTLISEDTYLQYSVKARWLVPLSRIFVWKYIGLYVNRSSIMTAPSNHACRTLQSHFPKSNIKHILNGIDLTNFEEYDDFETLTKRYQHFNRKSFLFVGRLGEEKSVCVLLDAINQVHQQDPDIKLFIVGDGPGRKDYEKTVQMNSLENSVFFLGRLPHEELIHSGLIHHARAMVTASTTENQPITVIEAIACNTPIIIPDVDGINELLSNNGAAFSENDANSF